MRTIQSVLLTAAAGLLLAGQGVVADPDCTTGSLAQWGTDKLSCTSLETAAAGTSVGSSCTSGWVPTTTAEVEAVASEHTGNSLHLGKWVEADNEFVTHDGEPMSRELVSLLLSELDGTTMQGIVEGGADACFSGTDSGGTVTYASDDCTTTHMPVCNEDVTCGSGSHTHNPAIKECHLPLLFTKGDRTTFIGADQSATAYANFDATGSGTGEGVYVGSTTLLDLYVWTNLDSTDLSSGLVVTHDAGTCTLTTETFSITHVAAANGIGEHILVTADVALPCTAGQTLTFDLTIGGEAIDFSVEFVALNDDFGLDGYPFNEAIGSFEAWATGDPASPATMSRTLSILGSGATSISGFEFEEFTISGGSPFIPSITTNTLVPRSADIRGKDGGGSLGDTLVMYLLPQARTTGTHLPFGFEFDKEDGTDPVPELDSGDRVVLAGQLTAKDLDELVVSNGPWSIAAHSSVIVGATTGRVYLVGAVNFETTPTVSVAEALLNGVAVDSSAFTIAIQNVNEPTTVEFTQLDGAAETSPLSLDEKTEYALTFEITDGDIVAGDGTTVPDLEWAGPASMLLGLITIEDGADMTVELGKATYTLTITDTDLVARAVFDKYLESYTDGPLECAGPWSMELSFESGDSGVESVTLEISNLETGDEPAFGTPPTPAAVDEDSITAVSFTIDVVGPDLFPGCTPGFTVAGTVPSDTQTVTATSADIVDVDGSTGKSTVTVQVPGVPSMRTLFDADSANYDGTDGSLDWDFSLTLDTDVDTATVTVPVDTTGVFLTITGSDVSIDENAGGTATFTVVGADIMPGAEFYGTFSLSGPHFTPNTWATTKSAGSSNSATQGELTVTVTIPVDTLDYPTLYNAAVGVTYPDPAPLTLTLTSDLDSETGTLDLNVADVPEDAGSVSVTVDTSTIIDGDSSGTVLSITVADPDVLVDVPATHPTCIVKLASGEALPTSFGGVLSEANEDEDGNGVFTADFQLGSEFDFEAYATEVALTYTRSI